MKSCLKKWGDLSDGCLVCCLKSLGLQRRELPIRLSGKYLYTVTFTINVN